VTASFSLNGIGLVPEEPPDLYQENEELKVRHTNNAPFPFCIPILYPNISAGKKENSVCGRINVGLRPSAFESSVMCARQTQLKQTGIPRIRGIPIKLFCRPF
jgi:hypothetical protein